MALITLLTDFGYKDPYVAGLKAKILSFDQSINIVDISHDVQKFHIQEASFILNNIFREFPNDTVHLIGVELALETCNFVIVKGEGALFVLPDNGILSMIKGFRATQVVKITIEKKSSAIMNDYLVDVACGLAQGRDPLSYGQEVDEMAKAFAAEIKITEDRIIGNVVYVDSYGSLITDLSKSVIESTAGGRSFEVKVVREYIKKISEDYKYKEASVIAIYNTRGYLEIAITGANPSKLLGVRCGDLVQVLFKPKQSLL